MYSQNVKIIPTHEDVFGMQGKNEAQIIDGLKQFSNLAVLHMCTKLMLFLNSENALMPKKQVALAQSLLSIEERRRLEEFIKAHDEKDPIVVFFHHSAVMMMLKLNLEHNDAAGSEIMDEVARSKFASLLVSLCDIWLNSKKLAGNLAGKHQRKFFAEGFRAYQARQFLQENDTEPMLNLLARGRYLVEKARADKRLDFDGAFKNATGMELTLYLDILVMVMMQWTVNVELEKLDELAVRSTTQFFKDTNLSQDDIQNFLDIVSFKINQYHDLNQKLLERAGMPNDNTLVNFITFMSKPILCYEDKFLCLSPNFLLLQLTDGPYNIVREELKGSKHEQVLPTVWGDAYESYALDRLLSTFGKAAHPNVKDTDRKEVADAVVDLTDVAIIAEIKYPHWSFRARITGKRDDMHGYMERIARYNPKKEKPGQPKVDKKKGLGQIKQFVHKLDAGTIVPPTDLSGKALLPLLILGEEYPPDPLNRVFLEEYAASEGCMISKDDRMLPFIVLTSEDVELIESLVESLGLDETKKLLLGYVRQHDPRYRPDALIERATSFKNEIHGRHIKVPNNKFMHDQLQDVFESVKHYFKKGA